MFDLAVRQANIRRHTMQIPFALYLSDSNERTARCDDEDAQLHADIEVRSLTDPMLDGQRERVSAFLAMAIFLGQFQSQIAAALLAGWAN